MKENTWPRRQPRPVYFTREQLDELCEEIIVGFCMERYGQELNPVPTEALLQLLEEHAHDVDQLAETLDTNARVLARYSARTVMARTWPGESRRRASRAILPVRIHRRFPRPVGRLDGMAGALHVWGVLNAEKPGLSPRTKARAGKRMEVARSSGITAERVPRRACGDCLSCIARSGNSAAQTIGFYRVGVTA